MILGEGVRGVSRDDVADPAESSTGTDPETRRYDEPEDSRQNPSVIELADARNDKTEKSRGKWIAHE